MQKELVSEQQLEQKRTNLANGIGRIKNIYISDPRRAGGIEVGSSVGNNLEVGWAKEAAGKVIVGLSNKLEEVNGELRVYDDARAYLKREQDLIEMARLIERGSLPKDEDVLRLQQQESEELQKLRDNNQSLQRAIEQIRKENSNKEEKEAEKEKSDQIFVGMPGGNRVEARPSGVGGIVVGIAAEEPPKIEEEKEGATEARLYLEPVQDEGQSEEFKKQEVSTPDVKAAEPTKSLDIETPEFGNLSRAEVALIAERLDFNRDIIERYGPSLMDRGSIFRLINELTQGQRIKGLEIMNRDEQSQFIDDYTIKAFEKGKTMIKDPNFVNFLKEIVDKNQNIWYLLTNLSELNAIIESYGYKEGITLIVQSPEQLESKMKPPKQDCEEKKREEIVPLGLARSTEQPLSISQLNRRAILSADVAPVYRSIFKSIPEGVMGNIVRLLEGKKDIAHKEIMDLAKMVVDFRDGRITLPTASDFLEVTGQREKQMQNAIITLKGIIACLVIGEAGVQDQARGLKAKVGQKVSELIFFLGNARGKEIVTNSLGELSVTERLFLFRSMSTSLKQELDFPDLEECDEHQMSDYIEVLTRETNARVKKESGMRVTKRLQLTRILGTCTDRADMGFSIRKVLDQLNDNDNKDIIFSRMVAACDIEGVLDILEAFFLQHEETQGFAKKCRVSRDREEDSIGNDE